MTRLMTVGGRATLDVRDNETRNEMAQKPPLEVPSSATFCATDLTADFGLNHYHIRGSVFRVTVVRVVALGAQKVPFTDILRTAYRLARFGTACVKPRSEHVT